MEKIKLGHKIFKLPKEQIRRTKIIGGILAERERQNEKWGAQNFIPTMWFSILIEEIGEAAQAANDGDEEGYRNECIQAAAVLVQMIECFDRNKEG